MKFTTLTSIATLASSILGATTCNPLKSDNCDPNPALAGSFKEDFATKSDHFDELVSKGLDYGDDGLTFSLKERFDNPSIKSNFYLMFGKVEVVMKAATGQGIISSFYLQSDDLDEIDIELFGSDTTQVQSNYFAKGDTTTYTRGGYHNTPADPTEEFITYTLDWSKDSLSWAVNGNVVRTLYPNDPQGYPQSPMAIFAGVWAGGDASNPEGTIEWAGGATTYGPTYEMHIKSLIVADYSTGKEYKYSDNSGDWESIDSIGGQVNGRVKQAQADFERLSDGESVVTVSESSTSESSTSESSTSTQPATSSESTSSSTTSSESSTTSKTSSSASKTSSTTSTTKKTSTTSTESTTKKSKTTASPVTTISGSTVWWTPTQTEWWTPTQTQWWTSGETQKADTKTKTTDSEATETATKATTDSKNTDTTSGAAKQTSGVPTTLSTVSSTESSSSASSSSSSSSEPSDLPDVSGSLDSSSSANSPIFMIVAIPLVSVFFI